MYSNGDLRITLGLDIGKMRNHTALVAWERRYYKGTVNEFIQSGAAGYQGEFLYTVVGAERLALGTPYPKVVKWVKSVAEQYREHLGAIVVDATGVGSVVMDMLNTAGLGVRPTGLLVTSGDYHGPVERKAGRSTRRSRGWICRRSCRWRSRRRNSRWMYGSAGSGRRCGGSCRCSVWRGNGGAGRMVWRSRWRWRCGRD